MKYRKWDHSGNQDKFNYFETTLDLSCSAYVPEQANIKSLSEAGWEQSTGTMDKNSKEIFVGDIATSALGVGIVAKTATGIEFEVKNQTKPLWMVTSGAEGRKFEVIGNIHETPELLGR